MAIDVTFNYSERTYMSTEAIGYIPAVETVSRVVVWQWPPFTVRPLNLARGRRNDLARDLVIVPPRGVHPELVCPVGVAKFAAMLSMAACRAQIAV